MEIRHGRLTREEGIELVKKYDAVKPSTLKTYLDFLQITEEQFFEWIEPMRDTDIWEKRDNGSWEPNDSIANHACDPGVETARVPLVTDEDRTFGNHNLGFFWREDLSFDNRTKDMRDFQADQKDFLIL